MYKEECVCSTGGRGKLSLLCIRENRLLAYLLESGRP